MTKKLSHALAVDQDGMVHLEFWAEDSVDDVCVDITPEVALLAAEALLRAARHAMAKKETAR
jgi:hypothetical protein